MNSKPGETYEVGYKRPPKATRFQKGRSGNPSGRPKKPIQPLDPGFILEAIDNEEIVVVDNGRRKPMKKVEIEFRQQFAKAIKGDLTAARLLVRMAIDYFAPDANADCNNDFITPAMAEQRFGPNWRKIIGELNALCRSAR